MFKELTQAAKEAVFFVVLVLSFAVGGITQFHTALGHDQGPSEKLRLQTPERPTMDFYDCNHEGPQQKSTPGQVSTGIVVYEAKDKSELRLDVRPCRCQVEVFHKPYEKKDLNEKVECGSKTFPKVQVVQK